MKDAELIYEFNKRVAEVAALFRRKQADYGPKNIAMAGERGVLVRLNDKVQRLMWLLNGRTMDASKIEVQNESIRDSWLDIADYGIIGLLLHDEQWPGGEGDVAACCGTCGQSLPRVLGTPETTGSDIGNDLTQGCGDPIGDDQRTS